MQTDLTKSVVERDGVHLVTWMQNGAELDSRIIRLGVSGLIDDRGHTHPQSILDPNDVHLPAQ